MAIKRHPDCMKCDNLIIKIIYNANRAYQNISCKLSKKPKFTGETKTICKKFIEKIDVKVLFPS